MTTFVAIYRGKTVRDAQLIAVSVDGRLCQQAAATMLAEAQANDRSSDEVAGAMLQGRCKALQRIAGKRESGGDDAYSR